jgi:hypothetical protein
MGLIDIFVYHANKTNKTGFKHLPSLSLSYFLRKQTERIKKGQKEEHSLSGTT